MRIAITVDPEIPVPPKFYGGIERIVDMLVRGLMQRGHEVALFAHPDSDVPCHLEPYPGLRSQSWRDVLRNMEHVSSKVLRQRYDIVHSFARLAYLLPVLPVRIPKLMSYQRPVTPRRPVWAQRLARGTLHFTGCSRHIISRYEGQSNWHVVYNGVSATTYDFNAKVREDAPLMFLGRLEDYKGAHLAIDVAQRSGRSLILAGQVPDRAKHQTYFREKIAPHIDGKIIQYAGPVDDHQKNAFLGQAAALLMPILWDEPFGIVMAEALACGTPVIGFNRGSVPEVVQNGVNGFVCGTVAEMVDAVRRIQEIDRSDCRHIMEEKFSDGAIVDKYEELYLRIIEGLPCKVGNGRI